MTFKKLNQDIVNDADSFSIWSKSLQIKYLQISSIKVSSQNNIVLTVLRLRLARNSPKTMRTFAITITHSPYHCIDKSPVQHHSMPSINRTRAHEAHRAVKLSPLPSQTHTLDQICPAQGQKAVRPPPLSAVPVRDNKRSYIPTPSVTTLSTHTDIQSVRLRLWHLTLTPALHHDRPYIERTSSAPFCLQRPASLGHPDQRGTNGALVQLVADLCDDGHVARLDALDLLLEECLVLVRVELLTLRADGHHAVTPEHLSRSAKVSDRSQVNKGKSRRSQRSNSLNRITPTESQFSA